jgi:hypothetical protein
MSMKSQKEKQIRSKYKRYKDIKKIMKIKGLINRT